MKCSRADRLGDIQEDREQYGLDWLSQGRYQRSGNMVAWAEIRDLETISAIHMLCVIEHTCHALS